MTDNTCTHCGQPQTDENGLDHPMVHLGTESYHWDCLPHDVEAALADAHSDIIEHVKNDTGRDYAARKQFAEERAERLRAEREAELAAVAAEVAKAEESQS
jgi:hypothetical protein